MSAFIMVGYAASDEYPYVGVAIDIVAATNPDGGLTKNDQQLRARAEADLAGRKGGAARLTNVLQREVSREKLLELAAQARTREEIIAGHVAASDI